MENPTDQSSDSAVRAALTAQSLLQKYDRRELQELLSLTSSNWLLSGEEHNQPVDAPPGIIRQMRNILAPNIIILAPFDSCLPLDYKVVHQIVRELTVGIYGFNQVPVISLVPNYDQSSTCQLPPAYYDTKVGQILINIDYTMKALWHGSYISREKRMRFSELWRSIMAVDSDGVPQTKKDVLAEFLNAGLTDISDDPCYQDIYKENIDVDPTYEPNSADEENLFSQYSENILIKLSAYLTSVRQHQNLFVFEGSHSLSNVVRLIEDSIDLATYQRLQKRLSDQIILVRKHLERNAEVSRDLAYLKLITFLVPLLISLRKKMLIPNLSQMLPPLSDDKLKTEREVPPHILGPEFACKHFPRKQDQYFHLHGGIEFDVGTPPLDDITEEMKVAFRTLQSQAANYLYELLRQDSTYKTQFPIPLSEIEGKSYNVISIELESLYPQQNTVQWWGALNASIKNLKGKRLPLTDIEQHEQFKKTFGSTKAIKCKNVAFGLKSAAERGLCAAFHSLSRRNPASHLHVLDEQGLSLLHHATANNQSHIILQLAAAGVNLNQTRSERFTNTGKPGVGGPFIEGAGLTPLHLAAQCGSLESLNCLLALQADYKLVDKRGWMAIHFAAFYGQVACIQALCRKDPTLLEMKTPAEYGSSPLLLSATSGSLEALDVLLSTGANWKEEDSKGNNTVHLAALYFHTDVLRHLIQLNLDGLPVWRILVEMIQSEDSRRLEMALRCLEALCVNTESSCEDIMEAGGIPVLVGLLCSDRQVVQCMATAVLCHMSENAKVCEDLVHHGAVPVVIKLLSGRQPELHSRCAVILADLAGHSEQHQSLIAQLGGVTLVVKLLTSDLQDVLVNAVRCIRTLCIRSPCNQTAVAHAGGVPHLVEFLSVNSVLQEEACLALAELARGHRENQELICETGAVDALVQALRERKIPVKVKAATALESIASHNPAIQQCFLRQSAANYLLQLLKVFQLDVREQGATSLWALAGQTLKQQKLMAEKMGYPVILDLLLSSSDKMQYVGCRAAIALIRDSRTHQDGFCREYGVPPLVRLLRGSRTALKTLLSVIKALGCLCIGVALKNNKNSQKIIYREKAIPTLLELLKSHESPEVKVQVAQTLACVLMGNQKLQREFWEQEDFSYEIVLELLMDENKNICLDAGHALSLFAYNNKAQQKVIRQMGGIPMKTYETFLNSDNETERAKAAFQIVVLARVISASDEVNLTARGVTDLVELLQSDQSTTVVIAAQLLASLAHIRAGTTDAIVTMGAIEHLSAHLDSEDGEVRTACASALGYLTSNRFAHRQLLTKCRKNPHIYDLLKKNLAQDARISQFFTAEFERQRRIGFPSLSLEINGGPPVPHRDNKGLSKRLNARCSRSAVGERETPAPLPHHIRQRARTANPRNKTGQTSCHGT
ncbi:ankyrin and armadillo repeat-containing protein isoform X2 [Megalobrama amblycephala]|uniref:ankyrin and armadillo repeat-containing protein isoform X2 n=1 Tax=Megalobrama amblycephala TaxID=75352 RepID=UPI002013E47B|nr:ankyrin and armadillo repeat-containing protein isoform X2 [Megalobrama amblycephala]